jgi:glycosyltransferase involved in cell wall biosynthesis
MRISAIVPTHNRSAALIGTLNSLCQQSLPVKQYEIVVVDNASSDDTPAVVRAWLQDEQTINSGVSVRYVREERLGLQFARHAGAKAASGDILAYVDDDAIAHENWLCALVRAYEGLDADCAGGKILIRWDRDPPRWVLPYEPYLGRIDHGPQMRLLDPDRFINGSNFSIKRQRLYEIGGFNPDQIGDYLIGDGETGLCRKIHRAGWRMAWVPDALVWHRQIVSRNATLADLKRRFANNGVGQAYDYYRQTRCRQRHLLRQSAYKLLRSLKLKAYALRHLPERDSVYYESELRSAFHWGQATYFGRLLVDSKLREMALRDDWIQLV